MRKQRKDKRTAFKLFLLAFVLVFLMCLFVYRILTLMSLI